MEKLVEQPHVPVDRPIFLGKVNKGLSYMLHSDKSTGPFFLMNHFSIGQQNQALLDLSFGIFSLWNLRLCYYRFNNYSVDSVDRSKSRC